MDRGKEPRCKCYLDSRGRKRKETGNILQTLKKSRATEAQPDYARYKFNNEMQNQDTIDAFVIRLRLSARDCKFDKNEEMIQDRIVSGRIRRR